MFSTRVKGSILSGHFDAQVRGTWEIELIEKEKEKEGRLASIDCIFTVSFDGSQFGEH